MGGVAKMLKTAVVDIFFALGVALVENIELGPKKAADTADTVSPGESASVGEFREGELVGTGFSDLGEGLAQAGGGEGGSFFFGLEQAEKSFSGLGQGEGFFASRQAEAFRKGKKGARGHGFDPTRLADGVKSCCREKIFAFA